MKNAKIKKNKKLLPIIIIILISLIILGGVGYYFLNDKNKTMPKIIKSTTTTTTTTTKKVQIVDEESTSRPYAIMINNIGVARPLQSGLQDAYIIYEIIVEGGITRYMALFMDQSTERIGSIRSSRHYFLDYALENDAIYVHHGQSPQAKSDFSKLGVDRIVVDNSKTGWRDKTLKVSSEHTLFTNIERLNSGIGKKRTTRKNDLLLNYSVDPLNLSEYENSKVANNVAIEYSGSITSKYEYDEENKVYKRSVNKKEHVDYVTGKQYTFKNIITYQVKNYALNDGSGKDRQGLDNIGSGTGYYISEGYAIPIKWEKTSRSSQTKYTLENGEELVVNDGNTFIQIQPQGKKLTID